MELLVLVSDVVVKLVEVAVSVLDALVEVEVNTIVVVPAPPPETGGFNGSRWKIPEREVPPLIPAPTAQPS
jgi:hypothetical protein